MGHLPRYGSIEEEEMVTLGISGEKWRDFITSYRNIQQERTAAFFGAKTADQSCVKRRVILYLIKHVFSSPIKCINCFLLKAKTASSEQNILFR